MIEYDSSILDDDQISSQVTDAFVTLLKPGGELNLSVRSLNCLNKMGIKNIGDLIRKTRSELLRWPNLGRISLAEIEDALSAMNLKLGMYLPDWPIDIERFALEFEKNMKPTEPLEPMIDQGTFVKLLIEVGELNFSIRILNSLIMADIKYIGDLVQKREVELLKMRNLGRKSVNEIKNKLALIDLHLDMQIPIWSYSPGWPPKIPHLWPLENPPPAHR